MVQGKHCSQLTINFYATSGSLTDFRPLLDASLSSLASADVAALILANGYRQS